MLRLDSVKAQGFRGIGAEGEVEFDRPVTIIFGENHQGKSSLLNAVEWALFGDDCSGGDTGIRERVNWEVVNLLCPEAAVEVRLSDEGATYTIARRLKKGPGSRRQQVEVVLPDGTRVAGSEAQDRIASLVPLSFRDFLTTVYQHQEAIRAILTQEPRRRNDAIDRLLGLSEYRNITQAVNASSAVGAQMRMSREVEQLEREVDVAVRTLGSHLKLRLQELRDAGIGEGEPTQEAAVSMAATLERELKAFCRAVGVPSPALSSPDTWDECGEFARHAREALRAALRKNPMAKQQQAAVEKKAALARVIADCTSADKALAAARKARDSFARKAGRRDALHAGATKAKGEVQRLEAQIRSHSQRVKLVEEAIRVLEAQGAGKGQVQCPVCGGPSSGLLAKLRLEWENEKSQAIASLVAAKGKAEQEVDRLEADIAEYERLDEALRKASKGFEAAATRAAAALSRELAKDEDPVSVAEGELREVDAELEKAEKDIGRRQETAERIEERTEALRLLADYLRTRESRRVAESLKRTSQFKRLGKVIEQTAAVVADLESVRRCLVDTAADVAQARIALAQDGIDKEFRQLTGNPAVSKLRLEVVRKDTGNDYRVLDQDNRELTPVLSQGDMNCLALALFTALGKAAGKSAAVGFLMFDDPSQSLGSAQKLSFAKCLNGVASGRQVIVSTMDSELRGVLATHVSRGKAFYTVANWSQERGAQIVRE